MNTASSIDVLASAGSVDGKCCSSLAPRCCAMNTACSIDVLASAVNKSETFVDVGGKQLRLVSRPFDQESFLRDGYQTGHAVWPVSQCLIDYLAWQGGATAFDTHCVELGCGLGLVGMAAASLGWNVTCCDGDDSVLEQAIITIAENGLTATMNTHSLRWGDAGSVTAGHALLGAAGPIGLILASDVLYGPRKPPAAEAPLLDSRIFHLFQLVDAMMGLETIFLLGYENRGEASLGDIETAASHFLWSHEVVSVQDLFDNDTGTILTFAWARCVLRMQRKAVLKTLDSKAGPVLIQCQSGTSAGSEGTLARTEKVLCGTLGSTD